MIRQFLFVIQERVIDWNTRNFPYLLKRKDEGIPLLILYMFPKPIIFADPDHLLNNYLTTTGLTPLGPLEISTAAAARTAGRDSSWGTATYLGSYTGLYFSLYCLNPWKL